MMLMLIFFFFFFFLILSINACNVGTNLKCINKSIQFEFEFEWVLTIYTLIKK